METNLPAENASSSEVKNSSFWSSQSKSKGNFSGGNMNNSKFASKSAKGSSKGFVKGLGITGGIFLVIGAVVALVAYIYLISPAISLVSNINTLKKDANDISEALKDRDLVTLDKVLMQTETDLQDLREARDAKIGFLKDVKMFKAYEFYADSDRFINAGDMGIDAIRETSRIVTPFADAAGLRISEDQKVSEDAGLIEAFQTWISLMPQVSEQMDGVLDILTAIGEELAPIDTSKYPDNVRGVNIRHNVEFAKNTLTQAKDFGPDIKQALNIVPELLGVGSGLPKRYMIIMQNDKEIRPTGGFWTNYATFKIQNAMLQSDFSSKDFYSIDNTLDLIDATYDFPDAPAQYSKYLNVERWYARDTNSSPDLPTSIDQFMFYYNLGQKVDPMELKPVDGIITIDTKVIEELMRVTGPVTLNGITYSADNVVLELEKIASLALREQVNRKGVLGDLMEAMLINVFESEDYLWSQLIDTGVKLAIQKHIQGYSFDPAAQALVEKYNLGGRITDPVEGDYSYVVSTNLGGDKTNWFVNKKVEHALEREGDKWLRTVKISYDYPQPSEEFGPFVKRFRDWVRVYTPMNTTLVGVTGSEDTSEVGMATGQLRNKQFYSGYLELGPGEKKEITFKYYLPANVVKADTYNLLIQKQSGIASETHVVKVNGKDSTINLDKDTKFSTKL